VQYQSTLFQSLNLNGGVSLTQGFVEGIKNRPLDHQHPLHYNQSIAWNAKSYEVQMNILGMLKKPKSEYYNEAGDYSVGEDNFEYATADGLPAWWVLNARGAYKYNKEIQVQAGLDNIFDRYYRTVASGSGAAGRTLFVSVKAGF
jgi:outer membrane receptor protein involved in Fe transport